MSEPFPYLLERRGVLMSPRPGDALEVEGVLNPAAAFGPDGELLLLPRLVAAGNVSRVGLARVLCADGVPAAVERLGVVLEPERSWERAPDHSGVEDPRITRIEALDCYLMTYVAYGPLGPRTAVATSTDLRTWTRLGPVTFSYDDTAGYDLNELMNKDTVFLPEPVLDPRGTLSIAVLHRPMGHLADVAAPSPLPGDGRASIWMSFVPLAAARADPAALTHWSGHLFVAGPEFAYEELKIGGGPPPIRVPEGWLLVHHGVTGHLEPGVAQQQRVHYAAGAILLDAERPWVVLDRSADPLLEPETAAETSGIVPNVVFPTATAEVNRRIFVFYGMADSSIGVAELTRNGQALVGTGRL